MSWFYLRKLTVTLFTWLLRRVRNSSPDLVRFRSLIVFGVKPRLATKAVGVEKLNLGELIENSLRQDALQAIFWDRVDIFYHRI
jgi:hypothetical protein